MVNIFMILTIFFVVLIGILVVLFWQDIVSFFFPNKYVSITMLESDNNVSNFIVKKTDDLRMEFNSGKYNLFESMSSVEMDKDGNPVDTSTPVYPQTSIYRSGRLGHFFFIENNENPLDFRNQKITGNPQLNEALLKQDFNDLWIEPKTFGEQVLKYIVPILIIIGIIIVVVVIISSGGNPTGLTEGAKVV